MRELRIGEWGPNSLIGGGIKFPTYPGDVTARILIGEKLASIHMSPAALGITCPQTLPRPCAALDRPAVGLIPLDGRMRLPTACCLLYAY